MIAKIINYENSENTDEWFHRIVVAGGDTYSEARGYTDEKYFLYEGEQCNSDVIELMSDFEATTLWASDETVDTPCGEERSKCTDSCQCQDECW